MRTTLTVRVPSLSAAGDTPLVAVRDASLRVVDRIAAGHSLELPAGLYVASVTLASGETVSEPVALEEDHPSTLVLGPRAAPTGYEDPRPRQDRFLLRRPEPSKGRREERNEAKVEGARNYLRPDPSLSSTPPDLHRPWAVRIRSARTAEVIRSGWEARPRMEEQEGSERVIHLRISMREIPEIMIAQVTAVGGPVWNTVLPLRPFEDGVSCTLRVRVNSSGIYPSALLEGDSRTELMAGYLMHGNLREASALSAAGDLLWGKRADPIGATLGAYALVRSGRFNREHAAWVANLSHEFSWLPDGALLDAEQAQRTGDPAYARHLYDEVLRRGLPLFTDGLSLLASHLRGRRDLARQQDGGGGASGPRPRLASRARRVTALAPLAAYNQLFVSYPGTHPLRPGTTLWDRQRVTRRGWTVFA